MEVVDGQGSDAARLEAASVKDFHITVNVHKQGAPLRPIVCMINSVTYNISKFLASILNPLVGSSEHHVQNTLDFVEKMRSLAEDRKGFPGISSMSMKSDNSQDYPPVFSHEPGSPGKKCQQHKNRAECPGSSFMSMKSDNSRDYPPVFNRKPGPSVTQRQQHNYTAVFPGSSSMSLNSANSQDYPPAFSHEPGPSGTKRQQHKHRASFPGSSSMSMNSDNSRDYPPVFSHEPGSSVTKCRTRAGLEKARLQKVSDALKVTLRRRCERVTEGPDKTGSGTLLNRIYTELYIIEGQNEEFDTQHEVRQVENASKTKTLHETPISCQDIFKTLPDQQRPIRVVLTYGVAGIGKTFLVQKFTLDWAEGLENQHISAVVLLSFRELNLVRDEQYSLLELIHVFYPTLQSVTAEQLTVCNLLFIFDGLDESRLLLDFTNRKLVSDVTQKSSVSELLTNLIEGNLLPSALIWITSRPAAANQIPPKCVDRMTEVRGFTDAQKEEYFRRRFRNIELSSRIISHLKTSRSLYIMCGIPVYCWITATVLEHMLTTEERAELPKTLTDMYSHFLLVQIKKKHKYHEGQEMNQQEFTRTDRDILLKLGRLAFEHLQRKNILFYQEDLEQCGLDVTEASVYSGVCTEIFKRESVIFQKPVYCFVHLSIQEFLAAVYMFHCYTNRKTKVLEDFFTADDKGNNISLEDFLRGAMEKSLLLGNSHLELFVRFLHGLSMKSNQRLLGSLLGQTESSPEIIQRVINNLKEIRSNDKCPDSCLNIFHCLMEMKDLSVHQEIQAFLKSQNKSKKELSGIECSALAYMLLMSEEVMDVLDLEKYNTSLEGRQRLLPAVKNCRKARLHDVLISEKLCNTLTSALKSSPSYLTELHLSSINLQDSAETLFACLGHPNCRLETLRFENCSLSEENCAALVSALNSNPPYLKHVDIIGNNLQDSGMKQLCDYLESPHCRLETLRLHDVRLSEAYCYTVTSALTSNPSHLRELHLSSINLEDSADTVFASLGNPNCRLETLRFENCSLSDISCAALINALRSNPPYLNHVDLVGRNLQDSGMKQLCDYLESPHCSLETLSSTLWNDDKLQLMPTETATDD
ncbi:NLR family CARD domain-containing protein 3-like [Pelmatolapia mariae]|uniref:NLR family CARD domain-containing protein 3-like n=1 Tax=Pelmatolapia mariae TaxID=158779 RepID=UPI003211D70A